jgi:hypothetical protein
MPLDMVFRWVVMGGLSLAMPFWVHNMILQSETLMVRSLDQFKSYNEYLAGWFDVFQPHSIEVMSFNSGN